MPKTHFNYGNMHLALDSFTGEILVISNKEKNDNLIKNAMVSVDAFVHQPFTITLRDNNGVETEYFPLLSRAVLDNPKLSVKITSKEIENGLEIKVAYNYMTCQQVKYPVQIDTSLIIDCDLEYTAILRENGCELYMHVNNVSDSTVTNVRFPVVGGVYLGEEYQNNTLLYPKTAGFKIPNPIDWFTMDTKYIYWRWNEYKYTYTIEGMGSSDKEMTNRGMCGYAGTYPSSTLSMSWVDLFNDNYGVYYGIHSLDTTPIKLECGSYGKKSLGLNLASSFSPRLKLNEEYTTPPTVIQFHSSNWHDGAKIYREFRYPLIEKHPRIKPSWTKHSVGLTAHYDFKYQDGSIHHKFEDIPKIAKDSLDIGIDHMILSGWNQDGFDNGYPMYYPDKELGGEEAFIDGIKKAKEMGVHVSLYENSQLYNIEYDKGDVAEKVAKDENGNDIQEHWGSKTFAVMCAMNEGWQNDIKENFKRATQKYGVDGIYFDQFSAGLRFCFNPKHNHNYYDWVKGKLDTMRACRKDYEDAFDDAMMIMGEWTADAYGGMLTYQLNQSFFHANKGFYPDMFRYTFPEFGILDMLYPKNVSLRPPHVAAKDIVWATLFCNDTYLWLYHMDEVVNFNSDPYSFEVARQMNRLNKIKTYRPLEYLFADTDGIALNDENVARVRVLKGSENEIALKVFRFNDKESSVVLDREIESAIYIDQLGEQKSLEFKANTLTIPQDKVSILYVTLK